MRREDQDKINRFSRLHQRETLLEEELRGKHVSLSDCTATARRGPRDNLHGLYVADGVQKDKEDLDEISTELEVVLDEDELIP